MQTPKDYFVRRAEEERQAAERSADPRARNSHLELAKRYADLALQQPAGPAVADGSISPILTGLKIL